MYSLNYSHAAVSFWFYSKDEATNFDYNNAVDDNFIFFKYKVKLFESATAQHNSNQANNILENATIAVSL